MQSLRIAASFLCVACSGVINEPGAGDGNPETGPWPPPGAPAAEGTPTGETLAPLDCAREFTPSAPRLRRLTVEEYRRSMQVLLGDVILDEIPADLRPDGERGFTTVGAGEVVIGRVQVEEFEALASDAARTAMRDETRRRALVGCDPLGDSGCVPRFIASFGRRAWRRALTDDEQALMAGLATSVTADYDEWKALEAVTTALLQSPHFLYRVELGEPDPAAPGRLRYSSIEMASKLAYTFWNEPPDEALLVAGESGALAEPAMLAAQAERLLGDPRATRAVQRFFDEYLSLGGLSGLFRDPEVFPDFAISLGASFRGEIERVLEDQIFTRRGSLLEVLVRRETFVNAELAALYGLPFDGSAEWIRTSFPPDSARAGLLGMGAFLATQAAPEETSPVRRGRFIRLRLLCEEIPDPPPEVQANYPEVDRTQTMRERFEEHVANPTCRSCHEKLDPLGLPLEEFDAMARHRMTDQGQTLDLSGELDGQPFVGTRAMGELLRADPRVEKCITRHLYRYVTGHVETAGEHSQLCQISDQFAGSGHDFQSLLIAIATSDGFRYAANPEGT